MCQNVIYQILTKQKYTKKEPHSTAGQILRDSQCTIIISDVIVYPLLELEVASLS